MAAQMIETRIGYRHDAHIWIDRAERIIFSGDLRARQRIEEGGFAHIR